MKYVITLLIALTISVMPHLGMARIGGFQRHKPYQSGVGPSRPAPPPQSSMSSLNTAERILEAAEQMQEADCDHDETCINHRVPTPPMYEPRPKPQPDWQAHHQPQMMPPSHDNHLALEHHQHRLRDQLNLLEEEIHALRDENRNLRIGMRDLHKKKQRLAEQLAESLGEERIAEAAGPYMYGLRRMPADSARG